MVFRRKGPLRAWRIADNRHPIYDGTGAMAWGTRWNSPGHAVIYASTSYACAMLERLAHAGIGSIPKSQHAIAIDIPAIAIEEITAEDVPGRDLPDQSASRAYGDRWFREKRTAVLVVPSVVARAECNVLINPTHPDFRKIKDTKPEPVVWDRRLFRRVTRERIRTVSEPPRDLREVSSVWLFAKDSRHFVRNPEIAAKAIRQQEEAVHHKRRRPKNRRSGCLMCKRWKVNGVGKTSREHERPADRRRRLV